MPDQPEIFQPPRQVEGCSHSKVAVDQQLAAYETLVKEGLFFNNVTIVVDPYGVHRLRMVIGKRDIDRADGVGLHEWRSVR